MQHIVKATVKGKSVIFATDISELPTPYEVASYITAQWKGNPVLGTIVESDVTAVFVCPADGYPYFM